jgi:hypothetical protein
VHPVSLAIKSPIEEGYDEGTYPLATDIVIADIRGGESLSGGTTTEPLNALGELLIITPDGSLMVRDELDDSQDFRRYAFAE